MLQFEWSFHKYLSQMEEKPALCLSEWDDQQRGICSNCISNKYLFDLCDVERSNRRTDTQSCTNQKPSEQHTRHVVGWCTENQRIITEVKLRRKNNCRAIQSRIKHARNIKKKERFLERQKSGRLRFCWLLKIRDGDLILE